jgi:hypothetical protein
MLRWRLPRKRDHGRYDFTLRLKVRPRPIAIHRGPHNEIERVIASWREWNRTHWNWSRTTLLRVIAADNPWLSIRTQGDASCVSSPRTKREIEALKQEYVYLGRRDMKRCNYDALATALYVRMKFHQERFGHDDWDMTYEELGDDLGVSPDTVARKLKVFARYVKLGWKYFRGERKSRTFTVS